MRSSRSTRRTTTLTLCHRSAQQRACSSGRAACRVCRSLGAGWQACHRALNFHQADRLRCWPGRPCGRIPGYLQAAKQELRLPCTCLCAVLRSNQRLARVVCPWMHQSAAPVHKELPVEYCSTTLLRTAFYTVQSCIQQVDIAVGPSTTALSTRDTTQGLQTVGTCQPTQSAAPSPGRSAKSATNEGIVCFLDDHLTGLQVVSSECAQLRDALHSIKQCNARLTPLHALCNGVNPLASMFCVWACTRTDCRTALTRGRSVHCERCFYRMRSCITRGSTVLLNRLSLRYVRVANVARDSRSPTSDAAIETGSVAPEAMSAADQSRLGQLTICSWPHA